MKAAHPKQTNYQMRNLNLQKFGKPHQSVVVVHAEVFDTFVEAFP